MRHPLLSTKLTIHPLQWRNFEILNEETTNLKSDKSQAYFKHIATLLFTERQNQRRGHGTMPPHLTTLLISRKIYLMSLQSITT